MPWDAHGEFGSNEVYMAVERPIEGGDRRWTAEIVRKDAGRPMRVPARCRSCNVPWGTEHMIGVDSWEYPDTTESVCPRCGGGGDLPHEIVVEDPSGRRFQATRMRFLAKAVRQTFAADLTEEDAREVIAKLREVAAGAEASDAVPASESGRKYFEAVFPLSKEDYRWAIGLLVSILIAYALYRAGQESTAATEDDTRVREVVEEVLRERPDLVSPTGAAKHPRNSPCTCGSGIKFKRCCGRP